MIGKDNLAIESVDVDVLLLHFKVNRIIGMDNIIASFPYHYAIIFLEHSTEKRGFHPLWHYVRNKMINPKRNTENKTFNMPPKNINKNESPRKEDLKIEESKNPSSLREVAPSEEAKEEAPRAPKSPKKDEPEEYPE